jgi:hypothetical protein
MVSIPNLVEAIGPIVEPQGMSLRFENIWNGISADLHRSCANPWPLAVVA